jgi:hypothetical protein
MHPHRPEIPIDSWGDVVTPGKRGTHAWVIWGVNPVSKEVHIWSWGKRRKMKFEKMNSWAAAEWPDQGNFSWVQSRGWAWWGFRAV